MIEEIEALAASFGAAHPVWWLRDRLGLSPTELRVVWVLVAHELIPAARAQLRALNTEEVADVTLDTLRRVVYAGDAALQTWRELGPEGALRRMRILERTDGDGAAPDQRQTFRVAPRILALAHGDEGMDPQLAPLATLDVPRAALGDLEIGGDAVARLRRAIDARGGIAMACGRIGAGRRSLLCSLAAEAGLRVLAIDAAALADRAQLALLGRECALLACVPLLVGATDLDWGLVEAALSPLVPIVLATATRAPGRRWAHPPAIVELPPLSGADRARLWRRALPDASDGDADLLASVFPLAPAWIAAAGRIAVQRSEGAELRPAHVEAGIRAVLDDRLAGLAARVEPAQSWDDLVLPDDQLTALVELLARIRERRRVYEDWGFAAKVGRGLGVSALFSGPPGTGKTMAAGLVAADLGVALYQVDLSRLSSKWIGETEKNLAALFDAAEAGHAILLFDEADALFGKRTAVRSSNDRHANHETNFLLQRLESFAGICILTTNHEPAIDEAFRRRLSVHVRFAVPELEERKRLWRALLPAAAPVAGDLPLDALASGYAMSGGYIRNAVLRAAFLAADARTPITGALLARAAQLEYEAMGKIPTSIGNAIGEISDRVTDWQ